MPGTTSLGIPFPYQYETVTSQSWQDLAEEVDDLLTDLDALRALAASRPSASISGGAVTLATNVNGTLATFTTEDWDTGGYADLGTSPNQLTVPPGIYWVGCEASLGSVTTITFTSTGCLAAGATLWFTRGIDTITPTSTSVDSGGIVVTTAPTTALQVQCRWVGTGGPGQFTAGSLRAYQVRTIGNL